MNSFNYMLEQVWLAHKEAGLETFVQFQLGVLAVLTVVWVLGWAWAAAKAGVEALSRSVAKELAGSKVRVNSIAPGFVKTALNEFITNDEGTLKATEAMIPMGRMGDPEDIVGAAIFLASDASSYITGTTIVIDGGYST